MGNMVKWLLLRKAELSCCHFCGTRCLRTPVLRTHYSSQCPHPKLLLCLFPAPVLYPSPFVSHPFYLWVKMRYKANHTNCAELLFCAFKKLVKNLTKREIINERKVSSIEGIVLYCKLPIR